MSKPCECGCGGTAPVATRTDRRRGAIKGQPRRYILGHGNRSQTEYVVRDCGHTSPCWIWHGLATDRYALTTRDGNFIPAHRFVYEREVRPVPDGLVLDHLCRVKACVNPEHLEPVSHPENVRRAPTTKLNIRAAAEIRDLATAGERQRAIAAEFGISQAAVSSIVRGRLWAYR